MQHVKEEVVQQGVAHMHEAGAGVSQQQAQHAFQAFQNQVQHNVHSAQQINGKLQVTPLRCVLKFLNSSYFFGCVV